MDDLKQRLIELNKASLGKSTELTAEGRGDDAALEKIRGNMYDIAAQVLSAGTKLHGDPEKARAFLLQRLESLADGWDKARTAAISRGDTVREVQEQLKVETMRDICKLVRKHGETTGGGGAF